MQAVPKTPKPVNKTAILAIVLVSYVMIVLDVSIVLTGLPSIHRDLGFTDTSLTWAHSAYTLAFGGFLLLGARMGDILGRRRLLNAGLALFTLASLVIGLAQSPAEMIAARAVQGLGAALLAPSTLALLQSNFEAGPARTKAFAYYSSVAGVAACFGLVIGGVLADWVSWRAGFFINLPIGAGMIAAALRWVPETPPRRGRFDVVGAITSTIGMTALVYGLVRSAADGWGDRYTLGALGAAAILLAIFGLNEARVAQPIMPLRLFASRERTGAYVTRILFLGAMVGFFFFTTLFLQSVAGFRPAMTGIAFLPLTLVNFASAMAVPKLTARFGNARLLAVGLVVSAAGMAWLAALTPQTSYLLGIALPMVLIGAGQGFSLSPLTVAGIAGVQSEDAGAASGLINAAHQLGGSLGLGILVAAASLGARDVDVTQLLAHRVSIALTVSSVMLTLALIVSYLLIVRPSAKPASDALASAG